MMNSYLDIIKKDKLHYWIVEETLEDFCDALNDLYPNGANDSESCDIEENYIFPKMSRTLPKNIPLNVSIDTVNKIFTYDKNSFIYPDGMSHVYVELYRSDSTYFREKCPIALKIIGDIHSNESLWHLYKNVDGVEQWIPLKKGSRVTSNVYTLDEISSFKNEILEVEPFLIDIIISKLTLDSSSMLLLDMYSDFLTDFFQEKISYEKLINYFKFKRVFREPFEEKLNQLFYNILSEDEEFKLVYLECIK